TEGSPIDTGGHRPSHHPGAGRRAQGVVVHHVVGVVVVDLCFDLVQYVADVGLLEAQAEAFAFELRTVHAASGITGFAIALAGGEFQQRVGVRGPANGDVAVPLVVAR